MWCTQKSKCRTAFPAQSQELPLECFRDSSVRHTGFDFFCTCPQRNFGTSVSSLVSLFPDHFSSVLPLTSAPILPPCLPSFPLHSPSSSTHSFLCLSTPPCRRFFLAPPLPLFLSSSFLFHFSFPAVVFSAVFVFPRKSDFRLCSKYLWSTRNWGCVPADNQTFCQRLRRGASESCPQRLSFRGSRTTPPRALFLLGLTRKFPARRM